MNIKLLTPILLCCTSAYTSTLSGLTLEEKVGQLLMVHVHCQTANDEVQRLINELHVGGIIYYTWANGLTCPDQVKKLSSELQDCALHSSTGIPLIIAIDHEGGRVHRFQEGFTHFPPAYAYALCNNPPLTEQCACAMGSELRAVGITMNLAPLADIMSNPNNPVIGTRSCGTTPDMVITHAGALLNGFHRAGIATSLKHFPGHGDTSIDSHQALPVVNKTYGELKACELAPFFALAPKTDTIMTAHLMLPELDTQSCATLSPTILGLLRTQAHFKGPIMTDSLIMAGITPTKESISENAINALNTGCDILLLGGKLLVGSAQTELSYTDIATIHQNLVDSVRTGRTSEQRLDNAIEKILALKKNYPLTNDTPTPDYRAHQKLSCTVAKQALEALINAPNVLPDNVFETLQHQLNHLTEVYHEDTV